jgi:hypothetical protein
MRKCKTQVRPENQKQKKREDTGRVMKNAQMQGARNPEE